MRSKSSAVNLGSSRGVLVDADILRASEAARRIGISTKELLRLVYDRRIRYVMVDGIAHIPIDALEEYQAKAS